MTALTLANLVANRTMSGEMAATLAVAAEERRSMLFVAIPRMAGKSTTMQAALRHAPAGTALHQLSRAGGPNLAIPPTSTGGYLVMSEISDVGFDDYLWGDEVRRVFASLAGGGFSLATALHAGGVEDAFDVICGHNAVPDEHAARIDLVVYIRSLGRWDRPDRRVVATMDEIEGVTGGVPEARLLHHWSEREDRFEVAERPLRVGAEATRYDRLVEEFARGHV
jgi:type IV secretory pathway ATPase VirB11/archaellum biosynthesis ATPase